MAFEAMNATNEIRDDLIVFCADCRTQRRNDGYGQLCNRCHCEGELLSARQLYEREQQEQARALAAAFRDAQPQPRPEAPAIPTASASAPAPTEVPTHELAREIAKAMNTLGFLSQRAVARELHINRNKVKPLVAAGLLQEKDTGGKYPKFARAEVEHLAAVGFAKQRRRRTRKPSVGPEQCAKHLYKDGSCVHCGTVEPLESMLART